MVKLIETFKRFFQYVKESEEGAVLIKEHDKIWQFDFFKGGEPFYVEIKGGDFSVREGWCDLDWKGKDWKKMNVIGTTEEALRDIMMGKMTPNEAMFHGKFALASRGHKTETGWLILLFRIAKEQMQKKAPELILGGT